MVPMELPTDKTIIYFWVGLEPIAVSFLCEEAAKHYYSKLGENAIEEVEELGISDEFSLDFFQHCLQGNPAMLTILFRNNNTESLDYIFKGLEG